MDTIFKQLFFNVENNLQVRSWCKDCMADTGYHSHDTAILSQPLITDMYQTKIQETQKQKLGPSCTCMQNLICFQLPVFSNITDECHQYNTHALSIHDCRWCNAHAQSSSSIPTRVEKCQVTASLEPPVFKQKSMAWFQQPLHLISKPLWNAANVFLLPPVPNLFRWCFCGFLRGFWFWFWFCGGSICSGFLHSFLPWGLDWLCLHWLPHWKNTSMSSVHHQGQYSPWECMEACGFWKPLVSEMKVAENQ